jgi:outer membrane PBP1 activator LpoA protein
MAQNDIALPPEPASSGVPVAESVPAVPKLQDMQRFASVRIALLLPLRSQSLGAAAEAVRDGFLAAYERDKQGTTVNIVDTDGSPQNAVQRYLEAAAGNDIVVGPLARSEVTAVAQGGAMRRATIVLAQPEAPGDGEAVLPQNMLAIGLSIEDEARQAARMIAMDKMVQKTLAISTSVAWQRRAAKAFTAQWRALGLDVQNFDLATAEGFPTPASLMQLKKKIQSEAPQALFVALDANLANQVRLAIGSEVPMYGTSQLNPLSQADWQLSSGVPDLNDMHLFDIPWQLQPDHPAVMSYPRAAVAPEQRRSADLERLYALGIDAFRIARELAGNNLHFDLDGVTGKLSISFINGVGRFERIEQAAIYQDGKVAPVTGQ